MESTRLDTVYRKLRHHNKNGDDYDDNNNNSNSNSNSNNNNADDNDNVSDIGRREEKKVKQMNVKNNKLRMKKSSQPPTSLNIPKKPFPVARSLLNRFFWCLFDARKSFQSLHHWWISWWEAWYRWSTFGRPGFGAAADGTFLGDPMHRFFGVWKIPCRVFFVVDIFFCSFFWFEDNFNFQSSPKRFLLRVEWVIWGESRNLELGDETISSLKCATKEGSAWPLGPGCRSWAR